MEIWRQAWVLENSALAMEVTFVRAPRFGLVILIQCTMLLFSTESFSIHSKY